MRFAFEQVIGLAPAFAVHIYDFNGMLSGVEDASAKVVPEGLLIVANSLALLTLVRFVCWACWGTERGSLFLKWAGISEHPISGPIGRFKRWWFNLDDQWQPK